MSYIVVVWKSRGGFVRNVSFNKSVMLFVGLQYQFTDLERFCANRNLTDNSILGIDPTFNLGDFYVTITTYEHKMLVSKRTKKHPVFIGPCLIHLERDKAAYQFFASSLKNAVLQLSKLNAFGTDGKEALSNAFHETFPNAVYVQCVLHKRYNILTKLCALHVPQDDCKELIGDIFGYQSGSTFFSGLYDAKDVQDFSAKLESLKEKRDHILPDFYDWFCKNESSIFHDLLIACVRSCAGLGQPPTKYTTNNNESINKMVKEHVRFRKQEWPQFHGKLHSLVEQEHIEFEKAIFGLGEYSLVAEFKHLEVPQCTWIRMSKQQKEGRVQKASSVKAYTNVVTSKNVSQQEKSDDSSGSVLLSVAWEDSGVQHLSSYRLSEMWSEYCSSSFTSSWYA